MAISFIYFVYIDLVSEDAIPQNICINKCEQHLIIYSVKDVIFDL